MAQPRSEVDAPLLAEPPAVPPNDDRRGSAVRRYLSSRGLAVDEDTALHFERERFRVRARALFYARLAFLFIGLGVLAIPGWSEAFGIRSLWAFAVYFLMVGYSTVNFMVLDRPKLGPWVTFVTLCLDLLVMVYMIAASGGLGSPLLATQLMFTTLFVILFPKPLAILPPLLTLPIVAKIDQLLYGHSVALLDLFVLLWYSAINFIIVYVIVYLNEREKAYHKEVVGLQRGLKELAVIEERNRLAREIHDGLGATLSSLIIQAEFLDNLSQQATTGEKGRMLREEIRELKSAAEESIDELRRNISMMRDDFELLPAIEDYCKTWQQRAHIPIDFEHTGRPPDLGSERQLTIFRVLQECLTNIVRHAEASRAQVRLVWDAPTLRLEIQDNGKGFDTRAPRRSHYGLTNMSERARKVGGQIQIQSAPGEGTTVTLKIDTSGDLP
ncbi:MAG: sensor histidine kinase [Deltaproteobacteria bacterium]|nr:MAG: sensor histidine kinase [Deltaproteobacteria bacterium]